jgi:hypothetical protein
LDLGTTPGVSWVFIDGGLDAQTIRLEGNIGSRAVGGSGIIDGDAGPECIGVCLEQYLSGQFSSIKARFPRRGAAVLACELAGLPWSEVNLARLSLHVTGKGNVRSRRCRLPATGEVGCRPERG